MASYKPRNLQRRNTSKFRQKKFPLEIQNIIVQWKNDFEVVPINISHQKWTFNKQVEWLRELQDRKQFMSGWYEVMLGNTSINEQDAFISQYGITWQEYNSHFLKFDENVLSIEGVLLNMRNSLSQGTMYTLEIYNHLQNLLNDLEETFSIIS